MTASDALAVAAIVVVAVFVGALAMALVALTRTLRVLRDTVQHLRDETRAVVVELRDTASAAADEVERVDRLVSSAERIEGAVDGASRMAYRTLASPVVKAMAIGTGVSRAAHRLRDGDARDAGADVPPAPADMKSERRRRRRRAS
jgi:hypothetical protein